LEKELSSLGVTAEMLFHRLERVRVIGNVTAIQGEGHNANPACTKSQMRDRIDVSAGRVRNITMQLQELLDTLEV
jgi:hypothetical protein